MRRIRELLRLRFEVGLSTRLIATSLGISKGAVGDYLQRAQVAGLGWPLPEDLDDTALERRLFPGQLPSKAPRSEPDWAAVDRELRRKGVTRSLLWQEYRAEHPDGYGYAWFCQHYDAWKARRSPTMRQTHLAGEKVFVDYAGDTIEITDPATGAPRRMKLFVAAMGASSYVYAEARPSEGLADWIGCHVGLFAFLGGVPATIVCDNLKAGVARGDRYEPQINRTYQDLARHYGTAVIPARPYKPRDKAKVEQAVLLAERWILARLRNQRFFGPVELNAAIAELVAELNSRVMRAYGVSRAELFATVDVPALKPLPAEPYAFAEWKICRVALDYHVEIDGSWYSVPYRLIREQVDVRTSERTVEIFHKGQRVASHARSPGRRGHTTGMAKAFEEQRAAPDLAALSFEERVGIIADREAAERDSKRLTARLKFAALRQHACVEDIDLRTPRGLDRALVARLAAGEWIHRHQNCLITGPCGVGKSWIACALGHKACRDGRSVSYQRVARLFEALALARGDGRHARLLKTLGRVDLLILDDWELSVLTANQRIDLLEILEDRQGRGSTIVTSQIPVDQWHDVIGDPTLADAILDRLVHNAHRLTLTGDSMRRLSGQRELDAQTNP